MNASRAAALRRIRDVWALQEQGLARICDVGSGDIREWFAHGVPDGHAAALDDLLAATLLLETHLREERVAEVVRRPAPAWEGRSLLELALAHRHEDVRAAVQDMFNLRRVQP